MGGLTRLQVTVHNPLGVGIGDSQEDTLDELPGVRLPIVGLLDDTVKEFLLGGWVGGWVDRGEGGGWNEVLWAWVR